MHVGRTLYGAHRGQQQWVQAAGLAAIRQGAVAANAADVRVTAGGSAVLEIWRLRLAGPGMSRGERKSGGVVTWCV